MRRDFRTEATEGSSLLSGQRVVAPEPTQLDLEHARAPNVGSTFRRFSRARAALARMIDDLGHPAALFAFDGRLQHETPALATLRAREPECARLDAALRGAAGDVARTTYTPHSTHTGMRRVGSAPVPTKGALERRCVRTLRTALACYRIAAALAPLELMQDAPSVLVTAGAERHLNPAMLSPEELMLRFGLTPREAEIARSIAAGHRVPVVATRLHLSRHTVRRHIEHLYGKLGVHSRAQVSAVIYGALQRS